MNDPHVVALYYRLGHREHFDYSKTKPLAHEEDDFAIQIADGAVRVTMKRHFATLDSARSAVDQCLRAWELDVALRYGPGSLEFIYQQGEIIDRSPIPGANALIAGSAKMRFRVHGHTTVGFSEIPMPARRLAFTADVEMMFVKFRQYRDGRTTLPDAANFCLTCLEYPFNIQSKVKGQPKSRELAIKCYGIELEVLSKIASLTANKGGPEARKRQGVNAPFTPSEEQWLQAVIPVLIRRVAEFECDAAVAGEIIKMTDLPTLWFGTSPTSST